METIMTSNEQQTMDVAKQLAKTLTAQDVVVLTGELGTGKTKFTQGIMAYFGAEDQLSSPTFTIVNEYHTPQMPIYHFDVYRLAGEEEFYAMGGDEYFGKGLCVIEWGETILPCLPPQYIQVLLEKQEQDEQARKITIYRKEATL